jgi:3D (Asp-Asp-Asp) domain-containing protein
LSANAEADPSQRAAQNASKRSYRIEVDAVAYNLPGRTALGIPVRKGVVAVDPRFIPLGTKLHVPGYGRGIAADVGSAIKGRLIDLWMPSDAAARKWGRRTVVITVFR